MDLFARIRSFKKRSQSDSCMDNQIIIEVEQTKYQNSFSPPTHSVHNVPGRIIV